MRPTDYLFTSGDLLSILQVRHQRALQAIEQWNPDQLLATAEADVVDYLITEYSVTCPVLHRGQAEQLPVTEEVTRLQGMWGDEAFEKRETKIVIAVPSDGEADVFKYHATTGSSLPPRGDVGDGELRLTWIGEVSFSDPAAVRRSLDRELDNVEQHLSWCRNDIERYNAGLRTRIASQVAQRRAKLLADRSLEAGIGFPIRQRPDASKYSVPVRRRQIAPTRPPTAQGPFQPEPALPDAQYGQALEVLRNARNALERSPSMTAHLGEEKIRDLLLMFLNAQFEGAAMGEVFNAAGKTDILIRAEDRNVFIAECKIWKSPKTIPEALTQLLSYLVWRDTKAALLLFIRSGQPTTIIEKAVAEIRKHPNFKRTHGTATAGERYDFVLHANGDPNQEIHLAFMPFALQDAQKPKAG